MRPEFLTGDSSGHRPVDRREGCLSMMPEEDGAFETRSDPIDGSVSDADEIRAGADDGYRRSGERQKAT